MSVNTENMRRLYASYIEGDVATVLAAMHPQMEWREAEGNPYRTNDGLLVGPDTIVRDLFAKLRADWDDFTLHPATFHDAGDVVVVQGRYSGVYRTTARHLDAQFCHLWTIRDGVLTSFQQYTDTGRWQQAMAVH